MSCKTRRMSPDNLQLPLLLQPFFLSPATLSVVQYPLPPEWPHSQRKSNSTHHFTMLNNRIASTCSPLMRLRAISWMATVSDVSLERLQQKPRWLSHRVLKLVPCYCCGLCSRILQAIDISVRQLGVLQPDVFLPFWGEKNRLAFKQSLYFLFLMWGCVNCAAIVPILSVKHDQHYNTAPLPVCMWVDVWLVSH